MKKFYLAAALLMASTTAYAGNSVAFDVNGQRVRIDVPNSCDTLSCIRIQAPGLSKTPIKLNNINWNKLFNNDDDDDSADSAPATPAATPAASPAPPAPAAVVTAPQSRPAPAVTSQASAPAPVAATPSPQPKTIATTTPAPVPAPATPAAKPVAQPAPAVAVAAAPLPAATTPIGVWRTEDDKGNVRIEQCGADLCGYAVGSGEKILIHMKPTASKWIGRIHDPDSDRDYDSSIAMKGPNRLKVRGCALGGLFCGGQIWKRVS